MRTVSKTGDSRFESWLPRSIRLGTRSYQRLADDLGLIEFAGFSVGLVHKLVVE